MEVTEAVADAIGAGRTGLRISPGGTVNGIQEDDTAALYPALVHRLRGLGLAYLHVVRADPGDELYRRLRADWPGTLIGNPVLTDLTTEAVARAAREMPASARTWSPSAAPTSPTRTWWPGCAKAPRSTRSATGT